MSTQVETKKPQTFTIPATGGFGDALKSEFRKLFTVRSTVVWAILFTGCLYGMMVLRALFTEDPSNVTWDQLTGGAPIFTLLTVVYGASAVAGELSNHMQAHSFLTQKSRWMWLVARMIVVSVFVLVNWFVGVGLTLLVAAVAPNLTFVGGTALSVWGVGVVHVAYALVAVGLVLLTRSRVAGLSIPLVWFLVVESLMMGFREMYSIVDAIYKWSPGHSVGDLQMHSWEATPTGIDLPSVPMAFLVPAVWAVVAVAIAVYCNAKRDVR